MQRIHTLAFFTTITLLVAACGGEGVASREDLNDLKPYNNTSQYSNTLTKCAKANAVWSSCSIKTLPPLAMEIPEPTIDDVMGRVVVSHPWMGMRFRELLTHLPDDMFYLFGAVTTIVIDADIRPSYYWDMTGSIYLDPASLWITTEEKDTINRKEDYRAGNESKLRFRVFGRHAINGGDAYRGFGLDSTQNRTIDDIVLPMARLLFHELAHANDYLPRKIFATIDQNRNIISESSTLHDQKPSTQLKTRYPLTSKTMYQIANILFHGYAPSEEQTFWTAEFIGSEFAQDGANDPYSYSSQYEDLAMLFEDTMMKIHFNVDKELAYIEAPEQKGPGGGKEFIGWGQRNRIGDPWVKERAKFAIQELLPARDYSDRIDALLNPIQLNAGTDWGVMVNEQRALINSPNKATSRSTVNLFQYHTPWNLH